MASNNANGSLSTAADVVTLGCNGDPSALVQATGTFSTAVLVFEGNEGAATAYTPILASRTDGTALESTTAAISSGASWRMDISGFKNVRVRLSSITSGTVSINMQTASTPFFVQSPASNSGVSGRVTDENGAVDTVSYAIAAVTASSTDSALVAAVTGKKIRVLGLVISSAGTSTGVTFNSKPSGSGTAISGKITTVATGAVVLPTNMHGYFQTASGEGLSVTTGTGATTDFTVVYITV